MFAKSCETLVNILRFHLWSAYDTTEIHCDMKQPEWECPTFAPATIAPAVNPNVEHNPNPNPNP